ncbi:MAG: hypothetical protein HQL74_03500 [Magnetococcales bacterium]|nr:hypothetical protein [Magnetococcales bacterium]
MSLKPEFSDASYNLGNLLKELRPCGFSFFSGFCGIFS